MARLRRIPIDPAVPDQSVQVRLPDGVFRFRFYWVIRMGSWFLEIWDANNEPVVLGLRVAVNNDLLDQYKTLPNAPTGVLFAVALLDGSDRVPYGSEAARDDLGDAVKLFYVESADD